MMRILILFILGTICVSPADAIAEQRPSLKWPTAVFVASAAADWTSTYRSLHANVGMYEANPVLGFAHSRPVPTVTAGAAIDVVGLYAWNRYVGRKHQKIAAVGLYVASGFRVFLAVRNTRRLSGARR